MRSCSVELPTLNEGEGMCRGSSGASSLTVTRAHAELTSGEEVQAQGGSRASSLTVTGAQAVLTSGEEVRAQGSS